MNRSSTVVKSVFKLKILILFSLFILRGGNLAWGQTNYYFGGTTGTSAAVWENTGNAWGTTPSSGATQKWPVSGSYNANFNGAGTVRLQNTITVAPVGVYINANGNIFRTEDHIGILTSPISLGSNRLTLAADPNTTNYMSLNGAISGTDNSTLTSIEVTSGLVYFKGANPYKGHTLVNGGRLNISTTGRICYNTYVGYAGTLEVKNDGVLELDSWKYNILNSSLGGLSANTECFVIDKGIIRLLNTDSYGRGMTINGGGATFEAPAGVIWTFDYDVGTGDNRPNNYVNNPNIVFNCIGNIIFNKALKQGTGLLVKNGNGTLTLGLPSASASGATNTYTGSTIINGGIVTLAANDALPVGSSAGTIQFAGGSPILELGNYSLGANTTAAGSAGQLDFDVNSRIILGTAFHRHYFKASNSQSWAATSITIQNWTGVAGASGTGPRIYVGSNTSGLTAAQLAKITFTGYAPGAMLLSDGELVPYYSACPSPTLLLMESFENGGSIPANWTTTVVNNPGTAPVITFPSTSTNPSGFTPTDGTYMVAFNSYSATSGAQIRLRSTAAFSTTSTTNIEVHFDWLQSSSYTTSNDGVEVQYSTDGTTWINAGFYSRYNASAGWTQKVCNLPVGAENKATVYIAFLFTSQYGDNCHLDNVRITGCSSIPMSYISSDVFQASSANIPNCAGNQEIIGIKVVTAGGLNPFPLTQIIMQMAGTAPITGIDKIHVYYTGNNSTFSAINPFDGVGTTPASGTITINGSRLLASGPNYFWIAYDMNSNAAPTQTVDAFFQATNGITVNGVQRSPTTPNPAGVRTVVVCDPAPGGVNNGKLTVWYKADNGVVLTAGKVSQWNTSGGLATGYNLAQSIASNQPNIIAGSTDYKTFNYNKRVGFVNARGTSIENSNDSPNLMGGNGSMFTVLEQANGGSGCAFTYLNTSNEAYQFKPQFRLQSGTKSGYGSTIDCFGSGHPDYPIFFPGEWSGNSAFITYATGINTNLQVRVNSRNINTLTISNNSTYAPWVNPGLCLGRNSAGGEHVDNDFAEVALYNAKLTQNEIDRVESYLAIKYGVTRGGNTNTSTTYNYLASNSTVVFDKASNMGYNYDIAGIGRDDASALNQKQSISVNKTDILTIGLGNIASENSNNINTFASDRSFLMWGNNGLPTVAIASTQTPIASLPSGIQSRIQRIWKTQATNFGDNFRACPLVTVGFETFGLVNYIPIANLRLLLDEDGADWSNATVISGAVLNGSRIEFSGVQLSSSRMYLTLGSTTKITTPLPVELLEFDGKCSDDGITLTWTTASETNNQYFNIERSQNEKDWTIIAEIPGANNSNTIKTYSYLDFESAGQNNYYRLSQRDFNGESETFVPINVDCDKTQQDITCYPNPFTNDVVLSFSNINAEQALVVIRDITGRVALRQLLNADEIDRSSYVLPTAGFASGVYYLEVTAGDFIKTIRIVKNK